MDYVRSTFQGLGTNAFGLGTTALNRTSNQPYRRSLTSIVLPAKTFRSTDDPHVSISETMRYISRAVRTCSRILSSIS